MDCIIHKKTDPFGSAMITGGEAEMAGWWMEDKNGGFMMVGEWVEWVG